MLFLDIFHGIKTQNYVSVMASPYIESRIAIEIKLSLLPSLDNPMYYNKAAKLLKMIGIQPKQAV